MCKSSSLRKEYVNEEEANKAFELSVQNVDILEVVRVGLEAIICQAGIMLVQQIMQAEAESIAGPKYKRNSERTCHLWGQEPGFIFWQGQKKDIGKPRVRTKGQEGEKSAEVELQTYKAFSRPDAMNDQVLAKVLAGVSTRDYAGTVDAVLEGHGVSKSAVSRRAVEVTAGKLEEFFGRRFEDIDFVAIIIDGIKVYGTDNIVAMGIDIWGKKTVLGFRQGATENGVICGDLIADLIERGLDPKGNYLFLLDGAKALHKAVKSAFGKNALIQRCQVHKRRNVKEALPKEHQSRIDKRIKAAYAMTSYSDASAALQSVVRELKRMNLAAAGSLEEGLAETLTVHRLGIQGRLRTVLSTTNAIESMFSMARRYSRNVKRWKHQKHIERTLITTLLEAERRFHRVEGYRELRNVKAKIIRYRATTRATIAA